jgi:hypothetical protein
MDPIHPISPVAPRIPPITPAPMIGGVARDGSRRGPDQDKRRRRPPGHAPAEDTGYASDERDGDDDSRLHVDLEA